MGEEAHPRFCSSPGSWEGGVQAQDPELPAPSGTTRGGSNPARDALVLARCPSVSASVNAGFSLWLTTLGTPGLGLLGTPPPLLPAASPHVPSASAPSPPTRLLAIPDHCYGFCPQRTAVTSQNNLISSRAVHPWSVFLPLFLSFSFLSLSLSLFLPPFLFFPIIMTVGG